MFDVDEFVADCRAAAADGGRSAIQELLDRTMANRAEVEAAFGTPNKASLRAICSTPQLTILHAVWAPRMIFPPHDHRTWAVIGIYGGEEANVFYRRTPTTIERTAARDVKTGECITLGEDTIHQVENPLDHSFTGAIHVYGGDYVNSPRSMWDGESLTEAPVTFTQSQALFDRANEALTARAVPRD